MPVFSRLFATVALACVLSSVSAIEGQPRTHHNHYARKSQALSQRAKGAGKDVRCKAKNPPPAAHNATTTSQAPQATVGDGRHYGGGHSASGHVGGSGGGNTVGGNDDGGNNDGGNDGGNNDGGNDDGGNSGGGGGGHAPIPTSAQLYSDVKQGLSWTNQQLDQKPFLAGASWCYDWGASQDCSAHTGHKLLYMPQFWCSKTIGAWEANVMGKQWQAILGMNEPNIGGQCNMDPGTAAAMWKKYIEPVDAIIKCSPAVTTGSDGMNWLTAFMDKCDGCQVDRICIHHYDVTAESFYKQAELFHNKFGKKLWLTEVGCMDYGGRGIYCDQGKANAMLKGIREFVYGAGSYIEKWAWYLPAPTTNIDPSNSMMNGDGSITPFAKKFLGQIAM